MKKIIALGMIFLLFFQANFEVVAKTSKSAKSSSSKSSYSKSSTSGRSYSGYSGASKSNSTSGSKSTGSNASGYSGGGGTSKRIFSGVEAPKSVTGNTAKNAYIEDYYKKSTSSKNYNSFKQEMTPEQKKVVDNAMNQSFEPPVRYDMEKAIKTRPDRIIYYENYRKPMVSVHRNYYDRPLSYGSASIGIWDMWFLMRASELFWYHHWPEIYPYRSYFDDKQFAEMESRVKTLEAQNIVRNPSFLEPGVDSDLQFSHDYMYRNAATVYTTNKGNSFVGMLLKLILLVGLILLILYALRRYRKKQAEKAGRGSIGGDGMPADCFNPLGVHPDTMIEFSLGELKDKGMLKFEKITELDAGGKKIARYSLQSAEETLHFHLDVFPEGENQQEVYLYGLADSIPFSEEFLDVAGQQVLDTPEGLQYLRLVMPELEERIEGVHMTGSVYHLAEKRILGNERFEYWEYKREEAGLIKYLTIQKAEDTGMFYIYHGELLEAMFFKIYNANG